MSNDDFKLYNCSHFSKLTVILLAQNGLTIPPSGLTPRRLRSFLKLTAWFAFLVADTIGVQPFRTELSSQGIPGPAPRQDPLLPGVNRLEPVSFASVAASPD